MGKEEVIDYVMTTPSNPNRAVLEGLLENSSSNEDVEYISFGDDGYTTTVTISDPTQYAVLYEGLNLCSNGYSICISINGEEGVYVEFDQEINQWEWSSNGVTFQIQSFYDEGTVFFASEEGEYTVLLQNCTFVTEEFANAVVQSVISSGILSSQDSSQGSSEQVMYINVTDGAISSDDYNIIASSIGEGKIVALREYISGTSVNYIVYYYCQAEWQNNNPMQGVTGHIFSNGYKTVRVDAFTRAVTEITN